MLVLTPAILYLAGIDARTGGVIDKATLTLDNIIIGFCLGGIAAVIYHVIFHKHFKHEKKGTRKHPEQPRSAFWLSNIMIILAVWYFIAVFLAFVFNINPIKTLIVGGIMVGIYIIADRKDLLADALLSAIFIAAFIFILENLFFFRFYPNVPAEILFGTVPVEEIAWAATIGFALGPLYEYSRRILLI